MSMVNDGEGIRLDTPEAVKVALACGKDLYNPQTGEFWWEYSDTGSIATTCVPIYDPNLHALVNDSDFSMYEDIVGGLNYPGYITDSIDHLIEIGEENLPDVDPRDEVFARIASEDGWIIASAENVREAVQTFIAERPSNIDKSPAVEVADQGERGLDDLCDAKSEEAELIADNAMVGREAPDNEQDK